MAQSARRRRSRLEKQDTRLLALSRVSKTKYYYTYHAKHRSASTLQ
ncbi:MAG: hypothetical protein KME31_21290 [Tolypothrix carrinoi HA7290-LM1]|nr:hypothetical protein [Tolypothrix carrinoi HA7290-LM1]